MPLLIGVFKKIFYDEDLKSSIVKPLHWKYANVKAPGQACLKRL